MSKRLLFVVVGVSLCLLAFLEVYILTQRREPTTKSTIQPKSESLSSHSTVGPLRSRIIDCRTFGDTTSYCVYENVCLANGTFLFLTDDETSGTKLPSYGKTYPEIQHYYKLEYSEDNILPYLSFIPGEYRSTDTFSQVETVPGCSAVFSFDFTGGNIFHWAMKVATAFTYLFDSKNAKRIGCERFDQSILWNRESQLVNDWQKNFLQIATKNAPVKYEPQIGKLQCYEKLFLPGCALYIFTGPLDAIAFRTRTLEHLGLSIVPARRRVVLVKRRNRNIVNFEQVENFVKHRVGKHLVDIVFLEDLSFKQQVEVMSNAGLLIATHGAGLTNSVFMPTGAAVMEICAPSFAYGLYERVATQSGHMPFRLVTQFNETLHSHAKEFQHYSTRDCFKSYQCLVTMKDLSIHVNMTDFEVLFKQVEAVALPFDT